MSGETSECIEYVGARNKAGYGVLPKAVYGTRLASRAALAVKLGRPVEGQTRHTCDNPPCVNPEHLLEGTAADNARDKVERGRARGGRWNQTRCINGHELTTGTVRMHFRKDFGIWVRRCTACRYDQSVKASARRKFERHLQKVGG